MKQRTYYGVRRLDEGEILSIEPDGSCRLVMAPCEWRGNLGVGVAATVLGDYYGWNEWTAEAVALFQRDVVSRMPVGDWELTAGEIQFWMQTNIEGNTTPATTYFSAKWDGAYEPCKTQ